MSCNTGVAHGSLGLRMYVSITSIILCHMYMSVNLRLQHISNYVYKCYISMFT